MGYFSPRVLYLLRQLLQRLRKLSARQVLLQIRAWSGKSKAWMCQESLVSHALNLALLPLWQKRKSDKAHTKSERDTRYRLKIVAWYISTTTRFRDSNLLRSVITSALRIICHPFALLVASSLKTFQSYHKYLPFKRQIDGTKIWSTRLLVKLSRDRILFTFLFRTRAQSNTRFKPRKLKYWVVDNLGTWTP